MNNTNCNGLTENEQITVDTLGYASAVIFTILFLPQVIQTTKTKSSKDISLIFLSLGICGCCVMIPYAVILDLTPILISNITILILSMYLVLFKYLEYKNLINQDINNNNNITHEINI